METNSYFLPCRMSSKSYQAVFSVVRATFPRCDAVSWPRIARPLRAGPGRALVSRASIFNSQLGQMSLGLIVWPQGRWTNSTEHDGLMLPTQIAETYLHLARQHRSTWTFEIDLRAFSDRPWWNH